MNRNINKDSWKQVRGEVRKKWGELTDDELDMIEGYSVKLTGFCKKRYVKSRDEAEKEVKE